MTLTSIIGGSPTDRKYAARILPLLKRRHLLLVVLLLTNAACMEALPLFLDKIVPEFAAILISVTAVLFFGEYVLLLEFIDHILCNFVYNAYSPLPRLLFFQAVYRDGFCITKSVCHVAFRYRDILSLYYLPRLDLDCFRSLRPAVPLLTPPLCRIIPQALCVRFSLAIGGNMFWLPWFLIFLEFPLAWPIAKLLDFLLGSHTIEYYKHAELKELVSRHGEKAAGSEKLSIDETTIIGGALEMRNKTVSQVREYASGAAHAHSAHSAHRSRHRALYNIVHLAEFRAGDDAGGQGVHVGPEPKSRRPRHADDPAERTQQSVRSRAYRFVSA